MVSLDKKKLLSNPYFPNSRFVKSWWPFSNIFINTGHPHLLHDDGNVEANKGGSEDVDGEGAIVVVVNHQRSAVEEEGGSDWGSEEAGGEDHQGGQRSVIMICEKFS